MMYLHDNYPESIILPVEEHAIGLHGNEPMIMIYPSPVEEKCILRFPDQQTFSKVYVYTLSGELAEDFDLSKVTTDQVELNLNDLNSGIYIILIETGNSVITSKLIKK